MMILVISLFVLGLFLLFWNKEKHSQRNIPGYSGIPLLGVIPWLALNNPSETLATWSRKLGDIYSVKFGNKNWIVLSSYSAIKQIFVKNGQFSSGRAYFDFFKECVGLDGLLIVTDYKSIKKLLVSSLRNRSLDLESNILDECNHLVKILDGFDGKTINIKKLLLKITCNVIFKLTTGHRNDLQSASMETHTNKLGHFLHHPTDSAFVTALSMCYNLRYLPVFNRVAKEFEKIMRDLLDIYQHLLTERRNALQTEDKPQPSCMIDDMILAQENDDSIDDHTIKRVIMDLFIAGSDTSSVAISWGLLYLAKYPSVQNELYQQLIEKNDNISYNDKEATPLICSFIDEILRHKSITALGVPHKITETFEYEGKVFRKGDEVISNFWAAHRDPEHFKDPDQFKPDRFVVDGEYVRSKHVIAFGIGPRSCLGTKLAEVEMYLVLCMVLKNFNLCEDADHPLPSFDKVLYGNIINPLPYSVIFKRR